MDAALSQKFPFILDRSLAEANCAENQVCTFCDTVVLGNYISGVSIAMLIAFVCPQIVDIFQNSAVVWQSSLGREQ